MNEARPNDEEVRRGAAIYRKPVLGIYDVLVIALSNSFAWRCPSKRMLAQYDDCIGQRHLDVGPGTGWYLARTRFDTAADVTVMDLNTNSLDSTVKVLARRELTHHTVVGSVLEPLPSTMGAFDSIGINYVMHCVPGSWQGESDAGKGIAFGHLAARLDDDGVLFGATILGSGVRHNFGGRRLMALYNKIGVFHNALDDRAGLAAALEAHFAEVSVEVIGTVALFTARKPRRSSAARAR